MEANVCRALERLAAAVDDLLDDEGLAQVDPGERHVVAELHVLLRPRFPDLAVSNENDRREKEIKQLGGSKIVPDLIVHQRGDQTDNLLVIEVKLAGNYKYAKDIHKLSGMTKADGEYGYAVGVHLGLNIPGQRVNRHHVYTDGAMDQELTRWFGTLFRPRADAAQ